MNLKQTLLPSSLMKMFNQVFACQKMQAVAGFESGLFGSLALVVALNLGLSITCHGADRGKTFATPEAAIAALGSAANRLDRAALREVLGLDADELVAADQIQATNEIANFSGAFNQSNRVVRLSENRCVLEVGTEQWPFPIPLVRQNGQWSFDTDAGKEEILNRRIGRNELSTLETVRIYVDAQRDYASRDRDGDQVLEYAQRTVSSLGAKDGLYWSPNLDGELSPLGPMVVVAQSEGYTLRSGGEAVERTPYHGYYFKILTRQGKRAPGGAYNYIINGNMIGGFALVAWPADYGESGIMTFIVNQQGKVYQKDLGPKTEKLAAAMKLYDPDSTWKVSSD
jgi:hypothetical protein